MHPMHAADRDPIGARDAARGIIRPSIYAHPHTKHSPTSCFAIKRS